MCVFTGHLDYRHTTDTVNQTVDRGKVLCCQLATIYIFCWKYLKQKIYVVWPTDKVEFFFN